MASGLPYVFSTEREQRGRTHGERLANACGDALASGFERLVVVGGDCPGLRARHLREAAAAVESGGFAVGRDRRGGAYLFSFDGSRLACETLASLPYSRPVFATALTDLLAASYGAPSLGVDLEQLGDVHDVADLDRERLRFRETAIREVLRTAVGAFAKTRHAAPGQPPPLAWHSIVVGHCGPPTAVSPAR